MKFDRLTEKMLWGLFYGYSVAEQMYRRDGRLWGWEEIRVRDSKLHAMGWRMSEERVAETYGDGYERAQPGGDGNEDGASPPEFAEHAHDSALDDLAGQIIAEGHAEAAAAPLPVAGRGSLARASRGGIPDEPDRPFSRRPRRFGGTALGRSGDREA